MQEKKTEVITFRTEKGIKIVLDDIAERNKWSVSQVVAAIVQNYVVNPYPGEIYLRAKDLYKYIDDLREDDTIEALDLKIELREDDNGYPIMKQLVIDVLRTGGLGLEANNDVIEEMTQEELEEVP